MLEIILELIAHVFSYFFTPRRRLEKNVKVLKHDKWFADLEDDFRYNHLIWNNRKVIRYLAVNSNVAKLLKDDDEKAKFKKLLTYEHVKFITAP
ncbi:hypothetical protein DHX103_12250 [Planococcus sp. X10-3]|uniref:hypothetical protein n=1 Tax=Planococcus sp. X10-3 TaxID=3061240 RepID=UPI003BB077BC